MWEQPALNFEWLTHGPLCINFINFQSNKSGETKGDGRLNEFFKVTKNTSEFLPKACWFQNWKSVKLQI